MEVSSIASCSQSNGETVPEILGGVHFGFSHLRPVGGPQFPVTDDPSTRIQQSETDTDTK